jgi:hypothetical protein
MPVQGNIPASMIPLFKPTAFLILLKSKEFRRDAIQTGKVIFTRLALLRIIN